MDVLNKYMKKIILYLLIFVSSISYSQTTPNLKKVLGAGNDGNGLQIKNIADPSANQDVATKAYVDLNSSSSASVTVTNNNTSSEIVYPLWSLGTSGIQPLFVSSLKSRFTPSTGTFISPIGSFSNSVTSPSLIGNLGSSIAITTTTTTPVSIYTNNSLKWSIESAGHLKSGLDNSYDIGGSSMLAELTGANGVWVSGNYAYIASFTGDALEIVDISNPSNPTHVGKLTHGTGGALLDGPIGVHVVGNYAFVTANASSAVEVVDVSNPAAPTHAGSIANGAGGAALLNPWNMDIVGNYLYVVSSSNALEIIDISVPTAPTHVGKILHGAGGALLTTPVCVEVVGNYAYIAVYDDDALEIVDVTNKSAPVHAGKIVSGTGGSALDICHGVWVDGNYAYVLARASSALNIIDISSPASPVFVSKIIDGEGGANLGGAENLQVVGNYAYIASYIGNALEIVDISTPASPTHVGKLEHGTNGAALDAANRVYVSGNYAYVASFDSDALEVIDISVPSNPTHKSKITDGVGAGSPRTVYAGTSIISPIASHSTSSTSPLIIGGDGTTSTLTLQSSSGSATTGSNIVFKDNNTEWARILNSGEFLIGGTSLIGTEKFSIQQASDAALIGVLRQNSAGGSAFGAWRVQNNSGATMNMGMLSSGNAFGGAFLAGAGYFSTDGAAMNLIAAGASTPINLYSGGTGTGNLRWTVTSAGHFVAGTDNSFDIGASGATRPRTLYAGTSVVNPLLIGGSGTTQTLTYKTTTGVGASGADHIFQVGNNGATEAMRILNSGNVGIANVSPSEKLDVTGNAVVSGSIGIGGAISSTAPFFITRGSTNSNFLEGVKTGFTDKTSIGTYTDSDGSGIAYIGMNAYLNDAGIQSRYNTSNKSWIMRMSSRTSLDFFSLTRTAKSGISTLLLSVDSVGRVTANTFLGGTTTTSSLTLKSTSGVGTTGADIIFQVGNNGATEAFRMTNDGRVYGTAIHNNVGVVTGTTNQYIASGTYTATLTNTTNVAASTAYQAQWIRVGNVVTVSGKFDLDATLSASTATELGMSLPIASNFTAEENLGGDASTDAVASAVARIKADATNDRASIVFKAISVSNDSYAFTFTYLIL